MRKVQVFILSKDRCDYLREALDSVLCSSCGLAQVIVSDNSTSDSVRNMLILNYPDVSYVRRDPPISVFDHYRAVIDEATAEYLVIFHDDDLMMSPYFHTMLELLDQNQNIAAVACNALSLRDDKRTDELVMGRGCGRTLLGCTADLLGKYFQIGEGNPAPFPGYMYRRKSIIGLYLDPAEGGKYSDVSFLIKLIKRGAILWVPEPLMWYRRHSGNDSGSESIANRLSLLRYIFTHTGIARATPQIQEFKFRYWAFWWVQRAGKHPLSLPSTWRERVVCKFLCISFFKAFILKPNFRGRFVTRLLR